MRRPDPVLAKLWAGDVAAAQSLLNDHYGAMHRLARLLGRDPRSSDELIRAAWVAASTELSTLPANFGVRAWLLGFVLRQALTRQLDDTPDRAPEVEYFEDEESRWAGHWKDGLPRPLSSIEGRLESALMRLQPGLTAVLVLRDVENLSPVEVQTMLGYSGEDVRALLHRARVALRRLLEAESAGTA